VRAVVDSGADAVEIGIPFSDPVMDGPTIQAASEQALASGATPRGILGDVASLEVPVPLAVMTYYNIAFRFGDERFVQRLAEVGVAAAILPDLPLEETGPWHAAAAPAGIETVLFGAPTADDARLARVCEAAQGFVYAVGLLGVTGEREHLAASALDIARRLKRLTDKPVLVGIGVSSAEQAAEVAEQADGVIVGSALIRRLLDGGGPAAAAAFTAELRAGLDSVPAPS
jgi:tryptophan synthase alpha chain